MRAQLHYGMNPDTLLLHATIWAILITVKTIFWWIYPPKMILRKIMWSIVQQTVLMVAHQLVAIIVPQLQQLQLYIMGHYPEMLQELYVKKSTCKSVLHCCNFSVKLFFTSQNYDEKPIFLFSFWENKTKQISANQSIMKKSCYVLHIFKVI